MNKQSKKSKMGPKKNETPQWKKSAKAFQVSLFCVFLLLFSLVSCQSIGTVTPRSIEESQPSWDGNKQNSGVISHIKGEGFLITANAANRYSFLTKIYGKDLSPPVKEGEGLVDKEDGTFILPNQYMVEFMTLSKIHKSKGVLVNKE